MCKLSSTRVLTTFSYTERRTYFPRVLYSSTPDGSKSKCHVVSAYGSSDIRVKGGSIEVKNQSTCAIKGQLKIRGEIGYTYLGSTKIIFSGTVASDEKTYYATGYVQDYPSIITHLTGAKK